MRSQCLLTILMLPWLLPAETQWVQYRQGPPADRAVVLSRSGGSVTVLCRTRFADGSLHPGSAAGGSCEVPQKGKVERAAEFEVAVNGTPRWGLDWAGAMIVGRQGRSHMYVCRAPVRVGGTNAGWAFGKAYREGPHARHCYVAFEDREIDAGHDFELLKIVP